MEHDGAIFGFLLEKKKEKKKKKGDMIKKNQKQ
jgi:hypothetical protein